MKFSLILPVTFVLLFSKIFAQCDNCKNIPGESIDFCFCDPEVKNTCVAFSEGNEAYWYFSANLKRPGPHRILFPNDSTSQRQHLMALAADKKLKFGTGDILFIEKALNHWRMMEGITNWDAQAMSEGWTMTASGLGYKIIEKGTGKMPEQGKKVNVHYTGWLTDGKKFDSSLDRKQSFGFNLGKGQVIKGWDEGVALFPVGSTILLRIPPDLGYGSKGFPGAIPPNSTLIFQVQILSAE